MWRATSHDEAIKRAEREALDYCRNGWRRYLGIAQAFVLSEDDAPGVGIEVFSPLRQPHKKPSDYVQRFFDAGNEITHQSGGSDDRPREAHQRRCRLLRQLAPAAVEGGE